MGQVTTQLTIVNRIDEILYEAGQITSDEVRRITFDVVVNPNATLLCLPAEKIRELGLSPLREVMALRSDGFKQTRIFQDAKVFLGERVGTFQCLELPENSQPLLGSIPMLALGLEIDSRTQALAFLPEPYFRA